MNRGIKAVLIVWVVFGIIFTLAAMYPFIVGMILITLGGSMMIGLISFLTYNLFKESSNEKL